MLQISLIGLAISGRASGVTGCHLPTLPLLKGTPSAPFLLPGVSRDRSAAGAEDSGGASSQHQQRGQDQQRGNETLIGLISERNSAGLAQGYTYILVTSIIIHDIFLKRDPVDIACIMDAS